MNAAWITPPTDAERAKNDTYAGTLNVLLGVGLDEADGSVTTLHEFAHVLLQCADAPLPFTTMDEQAAAQEGSPIPDDVVMVARLVEDRECTSEWNPVFGTTSRGEFIAWAGEYLVAMTAEAMSASVIVERWTREQWDEFVKEVDT